MTLFDPFCLPLFCRVISRNGETITHRVTEKEDSHEQPTKHLYQVWTVHSTATSDRDDKLSDGDVRETYLLHG